MILFLLELTEIEGRGGEGLSIQVGVQLAAAVAAASVPLYMSSLMILQIIVHPYSTQNTPICK